MRAVLQPFADAADNADNGVEPDMRCEDDMAIGAASWEVVTVGDCRAGLALLDSLSSMQEVR